jgi:hypothetical protein
MAQDAEFVFIEDDYRLTVAALGDLGIQSTRQQPIPEFEELTTVLGARPAIIQYLSEHASRGYYPELTFHVLPPAPFNFSPLVRHFDARQGPELRTRGMGDSVWYAFDLDRSVEAPGLSAAVLLNDRTDPNDHSRAANDFNEAGLVYVNQTVWEHRASLASEARAAAEAGGVELNATTFSQYLVVQAKRRLAGRPFLGTDLLATRFSQLPEKSFDTGTFVPSVITFGKQLDLNVSYLGAANRRVGVRRAVKLV